MQPDAGPAELPAQPEVPGPAQLETELETEAEPAQLESEAEPAQLESEAEPAQLESEAEPAQLETPTEQAGGACDRYVKDLEHPGENTFDHVLQEINKPAPPQLVQGVLTRLRAIRQRYYSDGEKTLQSCIHNLSAVGGPPLLHVLTAAYVVNGGVLLKHTQGHEEAVTDLLVDKQLEAQSETSTVAAGRAAGRSKTSTVDVAAGRVLERVSELTDVPSTSIIVRRERLNRILVEDPFEQVKAGTETCEDPAKELEDFLQTLEIEEISEGLTRKQVEARHQT